MVVKNTINRRTFLGSASAAAAAFTIVPRHVLGGPGFVAPSDRINLGYVGVGTQGIREMIRLLPNPEVRIVAVCDPNRDSDNYVDWSKHGIRNSVRKFLDEPKWSEGVDGIRGGREPAREIVEAYYSKNKPGGPYSGCAAYADFREMLEKETDLDAVKVMTPDHLHATVSIAAMKKGKHVIMHKPIGNVMYEARLAVETTQKSGVATHLSAWNSRNSISLIKSWIDSGAIGTLREVHNWIRKPVWPQWAEPPAETPPVPDGFDWDLWLGPAKHRPYHPNYTHAVFRGWYDFGSGILGDMGNYSLWPVFKAFDLDAPVSAEATPSFTCKISDGVSRILKNDVSFPDASTMRFRFDAKGDRQPMEIFWYDGGMRPRTPDELESDGEEMPSDGMMFVGDSGKIIGGFRGEDPKIIPFAKMGDYEESKKAFENRERSRDLEWIKAFKGGEPSGGNFQSVDPCAQMICLGAVALRVGKKIEYDSAAMKITNIPETDKYLRREYRKGWEL
ncbi:Gfo/Idh/MocA family protein [candidate division KSB1 bacterium]